MFTEKTEPNQSHPAKFVIQIEIANHSCSFSSTFSSHLFCFPLQFTFIPEIWHFPDSGLWWGWKCWMGSVRNWQPQSSQTGTCSTKGLVHVYERRTDSKGWRGLWSDRNTVVPELKQLKASHSWCSCSNFCWMGPGTGLTVTPLKASPPTQFHPMTARYWSSSEYLLSLCSYTIPFIDFCRERAGTSSQRPMLLLQSF